jgi:hypothetical protein
VAPQAAQQDAAARGRAARGQLPALLPADASPLWPTASAAAAACCCGAGAAALPLLEAGGLSLAAAADKWLPAGCASRLGQA